MRIYFASVLAMFILATGALFAFGAAQRTAGVAYTTEGARIDPAWSWRKMLRRPIDQASVGQKVSPGAGINPASMRLEQDESKGANDSCAQAGALRWLFVDFNDTATADEGSECHS